MSRIGKQPIPIPEKVNVTLEENMVTIKGPGGELTWRHAPDINVTEKSKSKELLVTRTSDSKTQRALHGLTRMLIANMIKGVTAGFQKTLTVEGVGYSTEIKGNSLLLNVGYSHPILVRPPEGVTFEVPKNLTIVVKGINKQHVGQVAAKIRSLAPPEPYKGKGIRYEGEYIRRKAGKKVGVK